MSEVTYITIPNIKRGSISIEKCICCGGTVVTHRIKIGGIEYIESIKHTPPIIIWDMGYETTFWDKIKDLFKRITSMSNDNDIDDICPDCRRHFYPFTKGQSCPYCFHSNKEKEGEPE